MCIRDRFNELLPKNFFQVVRKRADGVFLKRLRRHKHFTVGELRFVAVQIFIHAHDGLFAKLVRLLDDRAVNVTARDAREGIGVLIEADNFHRCLLYTSQVNAARDDDQPDADAENSVKPDEVRGVS